MLKSIGVRTSRSQRFETEGAPHEVGAASTLLAQIELARASGWREDEATKSQSLSIRGGSYLS